MPSGAIETDIDKSENVFTAEDRPLAYDVVDSATPAVPLDVSAFDLIWELKVSLDAATALVTKATGGGGITVGDGVATNDRATVDLTDADTAGLKPGTYFHVLRRTNSANASWLSYGKITITSSGQTAP